MPPETNVKDEQAPLLPANQQQPAALPAVSTLPSQPLATSTGDASDGQTAASFIPILGLLIFGIGAGWVIGHYHGSMLWIIPAIAVISGLAHRRISHFKKYLLHMIIRTGEKERVYRYSLHSVYSFWFRLKDIWRVWSGLT